MDAKRVKPVCSVVSALLYMFNAGRTWTHNIYVYTYRRRVQLLTMSVTIGVLFMLIAVLWHMLPGGTHHLSGGMYGARPRRDVHYRMPPVYNPETARQ